MKLTEKCEEGRNWREVKIRKIQEYILHQMGAVKHYTPQ